ncbi:DUF3618 domain-containing protein [Rhodococcus sp. NPDC057014]|uniref:DUF3618 domain-containing protein n=1 Tax=Rhodococcus sp. NPDC057014 TaxID=3346000 RepID=UPI003634C8E2
MTAPHESTPDGDALTATAERQRAELATTVDALTRKADVPARVKAGTRHQLDTVRHELANVRNNPRLAALLGGLTAGVVALVVVRRARHR